MDPDLRQSGQTGEIGATATPHTQPEALPKPLTSESCDDLRVLVDLEHPLPPGYEPADLVPLSVYGVPVLDEDMFLREEAARSLKQLVSAANEAGEELVVASAYRSYADQKSAFDHHTVIYGEHAREVSAPPGHSQHQLGTAVDFTNAEADYMLWWPFGDTSASRWLERHAWKYGYALAYPGGHETETGYQWEPWHYRYIGAGNTRHMKEAGLSLQTYLTKAGIVPLC